MANSSNKANDVIKAEVTTFLSGQKNLAADLQKQLTDFLLQIEPMVEGFLANPTANTLNDLNFLRDAVVAKTAEVALEAAERERQAVASIVVSVVHTAIALAVAA